VDPYPDQTVASGSGAMKRRLTDTPLGRNNRIRSRSPISLSETLTVATSDSYTPLDLDVCEDRRLLSLDQRSEHVGFSAKLGGQDSEIGSGKTQALCATPRSRLWRSPRPLERGPRETLVSTTVERDVLTRLQRSTRSLVSSFP
jgi:hypothetical protein